MMLDYHPFGGERVNVKGDGIENDPAVGDGEQGGDPQPGDGIAANRPDYGAANGTIFDTKKKYTGKELDDETGLYYYGARYYDPRIGRFISEDPVSRDVSQQQLFSQPQRFNTYSYALNNPVRYTDPSGEFAFAAFAIPSAATLIEGAFDAVVLYVGYKVFTKPQSLIPPTVDSRVWQPLIPPAVESSNRTITPVAPAPSNVLVTPKVQNPNSDSNILTTPALPQPGITIGGCGSGAMMCEHQINLPQTPEEFEKAGYEWKGKGEKGIEKGNWVNPKTQERINPDRNHPLPQGPHDDYTDPSGTKWRVTPDGKATLKK